MNLSDFFPAQVGAPLTKQKINLLIAALKERILKSIKFRIDPLAQGTLTCSSNGLVRNQFTTPAFAQSNTDSSTQSYLEYILDNFLNPSAELISLSFLPYEDMMINGYIFNQGQPKYVWAIDFADASDYEEKNVIFSIKDASLYFVADGKWVKDNGKLIILNNDKVILRLLNELNAIYTTSFYVPALISSDSNSTLQTADILDTLRYFVKEKPSRLGSLANIGGSDLPSVGGQRQSLGIGCNNNSEGSKTYSPNLVYTNPGNSSIVSQNNAFPYSRTVFSPVNFDIINENFLFLVTPVDDPDVLLDFPFILSDYFLSQFLSINLFNFVLLKQNSFQFPKPNYTAALINSIYYLIDYLRYIYDGTASNDNSCGCNGVSLSIGFSASFSSILATYSVSQSKSNDVLLLGICPAAVGANPVSSGTFAESCQFSNAGTVSSSAGLSGPGFIAVPPNTASSAVASSITSDCLVWKKSFGGFSFEPFFQSTSPACNCHVFLDLFNFLEIK